MTPWVRNSGKLGAGPIFFCPLWHRQRYSVRGWAGLRVQGNFTHASALQEMAGCLNWSEMVNWCPHSVPPGCQSWESWVSYKAVQGSQREHLQRPELMLQGIFNSEWHVLWATQVTKANPDLRGRELGSPSQ